MAEVTSIVGRFDGVIAYSDETWGSFHCQIETFDLTNDTIWSLAEAVSEENLKRVYNESDNKAKVVELFESLPFVNTFVWADVAQTGKTISDIVLHLYLLVTFDDKKTYPVSITHEKGEVRYHTQTATDLLSGSSNKATFDEKVEEMLGQIMASADIQN